MTKVYTIVYTQCKGRWGYWKLQNYLKNEKDALYVSGFVIEGMMSNYINKINGSFYNILGVPVEEIYKNLKKMGYNLNMFKKS